MALEQYLQHATRATRALRGLEQEQLAHWATMALVVGIAYSASVTTWHLVSVFHHPAPVSLPASVSTVRTPIQMAEGDSLANLHLFGDAQQPVGQAVDAPDTRLNLTLNGVIASSDERIARAFIATVGGSEKGYRLGAGLPGGAILKEIHPDRVILLRGGQYETLRMPKKTDSIVLSDDAPAAAKPTEPRITAKVSREEVLQYKQKLLTAPKELAGAIRQRPVRRNGKIVGYRVFPGKDREAFKRLGLKPGDIITQVNGMPLGDPASAMAIYGQLPQMSELNIQVQRGGQDMSLVLPWN